MELANLIWHLGAALAALWAALSYRALNVRYTEMRQAVLATLLPGESPGTGASSPLLRERSLRVRALRWVVNECQRNHGVDCEVVGQNELLTLEHQQWVIALGGLLRLSSETLGSGKKVKLKWNPIASSAATREGEGQWDIV